MGMNESIYLTVVRTALRRLCKKPITISYEKFKITITAEIEREAPPIPDGKPEDLSNFA